MMPPANSSALRPTVLRFPVGREKARAPATSLPSIQIIDDDAPLGAALSAGLESRGFQTTFSTNATEAWTTAHSLHPDLILCDINMPGKNGHRLLKEIRGDPALSNCQFVFMTGNPLFAHPRKGMDLGADDFLLKPFTLEALVTCITARFHRREISQQGEASLINQLRTNLKRSLPHEFFTPLNGIMGYTELLEQDINLMKPDEIADALGNVMLSGRRLHRTLRNYLFTLDRLDTDSDTPFPVISGDSVLQLLEQGIMAAAKRHRRKVDLRLALTGAPLCASPRELSILIEELVDNAFSFSAAGTPVRIESQRQGADLEVIVTDQGRGLSAAQLKALGAFRQFERDKFEQQGLGLGLFMIRQILRRMEGSLEIESTVGRGTVCRVRLPVCAQPNSPAGNP